MFFRDTSRATYSANAVMFTVAQVSFDLAGRIFPTRLARIKDRRRLVCQNRAVGFCLLRLYFLQLKLFACPSTRVLAYESTSSSRLLF